MTTAQAEAKVGAALFGPNKHINLQTYDPVAVDSIQAANDVTGLAQAGKVAQGDAADALHDFASRRRPPWSRIRRSCHFHYFRRRLGRSRLAHT